MKSQTGSYGSSAPQVPTHVRDRTTVIVSTKKWWAEETWTPCPYLEPLSCDDVSAPALSRATFLYRYGHQTREDDPLFADEDPLALKGHYVRIQGIFHADTQPTHEYPEQGDTLWTLWTGVFTEESFAIQGSQSGGVPAGDQTITAFGLDVLLEHIQLTDVMALQTVLPETESPGVYEDDTEVQLISTEKIPEFNRRWQLGDAPTENRSYYADVYGADGYVFAGRVDYTESGMGGMEDAEDWTLKDIAKYLLNYNQPNQLLYPPGPDDIQFLLTLQTADTMANIRVSRRLAGLNIREALNRLIDRRRGLGWCIRIYDDAPGIVEIYVYSHTPDDILVNETVVLPANPEQTSIHFTGGYDTREVTVRRSQTPRYERILVRGNYIRTMFSLQTHRDGDGNEDGELRAAWDSTQEYDYKAATGSDDYPKANDEYRKEDAFSRVYTRFQVFTGWQGQCGIGTTTNCLPTVDSGNVTAPVWGAHDTLFTDGRNFLDRLPAREDDVYSIPEQSHRELLRPMAFVYDDTQGRWVRFPGTIRMIPGELAIELKAGAHKHMLARNHWFLDEPQGGPIEPALGTWPGSSKDDWDGTETTPNGDTVDVARGWDYDNIRVTLALETDRRIHVQSDLVIAPEQKPDVGRQLVIDVPEAHYWVMADKTITGLDSNGSPSISSYTVIRDDMDILKTIAAIARAWYSEERATLQLTRSVIANLPGPGVMITSLEGNVTGQPIKTVVTRRRWDFSRDGHTTTIETSHAELDWKAVANV